jgi:hypothetical protein
MFRQLLLAFTVVALLAPKLFAREVDPRPRPLVQIAILLDTSNSMDGLIHQAQTQLWTIVNETARCKREGRQPHLEVALYEYGNSRLPVTEGYIRQVLPFTDDLDRVSEKLFGLTTCGGDEYCGQVIRQATRELEWESSAAFRAIFIAGNEPFSQGSVNYRESCKRAIGRGIVVNTIHCGSESDGIAGGWRDGAMLAEGKFMNINQDVARPIVHCPQDEIIIKLSAELNSTYVPFGTDGARGANCQSAQDSNAATAKQEGADVQRAVTKAAPVYSNSSWDLVDAVKDGKCDVTKLQEKELPEAMKKLNPEERQNYVKEQGTKRGAIQDQIKQLNADREKYIASQERDQANVPQTLDSAVVTTVREQLKSNSFEVPEK